MKSDSHTLSSPANRSVVLQARGLTKRFTEGRLDVTVLHGVDLDVYAGETLAIGGASGSGKSTLLHLLGALDAPTSGSVQLHGQNLAELSAAQQGALRNEKLGYKVREAQVAKVPYMLVIGDKEMEEGNINIRPRKGDSLGAMSVEDFAKLVKEECMEPFKLGGMAYTFSQ